MKTRFTVDAKALALTMRTAIHASTTDGGVPVGVRAVQFTFGPGDKHTPHFDHATMKERTLTGPALSVAATDRYRLAWATTTVTPEEGTPPGRVVDFKVHAESVRGWLALMPKQHTDMVVQVTVDAEEVRFTIDTDTLTQTTVLPLMDGQVNYPKLGRVIQFGDFDQPQSYLVDSTLAAQMFIALTKVRRWREPVLVSSSGENRPVRFATQGSDSFLASGLIMPIRKN